MERRTPGRGRSRPRADEPRQVERWRPMSIPKRRRATSQTSHADSPTERYGMSEIKIQDGVVLNQERDEVIEIVELDDAWLDGAAGGGFIDVFCPSTQNAIGC